MRGASLRGAGGLLLVLAGCAAPAPDRPPAPAPPAAAPVVQPPAAAPTATEASGQLRLLCEDGVALRVQFQPDQVQVAGLPGGPDTLLRDAGGVTPQQSVYSSPRARLEFGVGADGREAALHLLQPDPRTLHCRRG